MNLKISWLIWTEKANPRQVRNRKMREIGKVKKRRKRGGEK